MNYTVSKSLEIAGAHKLNLTYDSPCQNLHGHNWNIKVFVRAAKLDDNGMVIDFKHIKEVIHNQFDHKYLNDILPEGFNPTAENMCRYFMCQIPDDPKRKCYCYRVEIQESSGNVASLEVNSYDEYIHIQDTLMEGCK